MHLMKETLDNLREKNVEISNEEYEGALLAILLHDVGHTPYSHALEGVLLPGIGHEQVSAIILNELFKQYGGNLKVANLIFNNQYPRKFLNQLVSSQLDIDRMDYLNRDSFFTGVSEGKVSSKRIIKLLNVVLDEIVIEEKGIYSIENFLNARRLMYWQVYLHKTAVSVEKMLVQIINRARSLGPEVSKGISDELAFFLNSTVELKDLSAGCSSLMAYTSLDDVDVMSAIKSWKKHNDPILSLLCKNLLERNLFKVKLFEDPLSEEEFNKIKALVIQSYDLPEDEIENLILTGTLSNAAYIGGDSKINVLKKSGELIELTEASDLPNILAMRKIVKKFYLCSPKIISL